MDEITCQRWGCITVQIQYINCGILLNPVGGLLSANMDVRVPKSTAKLMTKMHTPQWLKEFKKFDEPN